MKRVEGGGRTSRKRGLGAMLAGSTGVLAAAGIAGAASATILVYTALGATELKGSDKLNWVQQLASVVAVVAGTSTSAPPPAKTVSTTLSVLKPAAVQQPAAVPGVRPMKLGMNLHQPNYYQNVRAFSNLLYGSSWGLRDARGVWSRPTADRYDANRNITYLNPGEEAGRQLNVPTKAYLLQSVDIICRWKGQGSFRLDGHMIRNFRQSSSSLTFSYVPRHYENAMIYISKTDPSDPVRDLDCRETDADPDALFDPAYLEMVSRYNTIRFLKWMWAAEQNLKVTWATRAKAGANEILVGGAIPVEYMVQLANEAKANPWFTIPWNADDEYIRNFAIYVRDHLDPGLQAYVETSNEVWNWGYPVTAQARDEGMAKSLSNNEGIAVVRRYSERTVEVMDIWSSVFANQMSRIVRVAATHNAPLDTVQLIVSFRDTAKKIDAVATAPYFDTHLANSMTEAEINDRWAFIENSKLVGALSAAAVHKKIAESHGLRFITYEAGQHITSPNNVELLKQFQRDQRMGRLYTHYLSRWRQEFGDLMVLFADVESINQYGAWGLQEYMGQPLSDAPKAAAVELFRKSYPVK